MENSGRSENPAARVVWIRLFAPFLFGLLLYWLAGVGARSTFQDTWFRAFGPGAEPPWYFIGQDAVAALWSGAATVLMLIFSFASHRRLGPTVWSAFAVTLLGLVSTVGAGVNIWLHTRNIWQQDLAWSAWPDFHAYSASQTSASIVSMGIGVALGALCLYRYRTDLKAAAGEG